MRILLDEGVNQKMRNRLPGHECQSTRYAGFGGLKNGELLDAAEAAGFDVLGDGGARLSTRSESGWTAPGLRPSTRAGRESLKNLLGLRLECREMVAMAAFRP
jgi:hypothetical protein